MGVTSLCVGPEKRLPAPAAKRTPRVFLCAPLIGNSLPEMSRVTTVKRIIAAVSVVVSLMPAVSVSAEQPGATEPAGRQFEMPGAKFRKRPQLAVDAVHALTHIMRTENKEDPQYLEARLVVSNAVATRMKVDPVQLQKAWSRAPRAHQIAVLAAISQIDVRYVEGKESPYVQMDCSGLMWYSWRVAGVDAPRQAVSQMDRLMRVERKDAITGDIVGEGTHVQMYLGVGLAFIHAPFGGKKVKFKTMSDEQAARVVWANPSHIATYRL